MKTPLNTKTWTKIELSKLEICYRANLPLTLMSGLFNKSVNSISKALTRSGIRPLGSRARGARPLHERSTIVTKEDALRLVQDVQKNPAATVHCAEPSVPFYLTRYRVKRPRLRFSKRPLRQQQETWTSLTHILEYFASKGVKVESTDDPNLLRQDYAFLMNGSPIKASELLKIVNQERAEANLPRIFVDGITDNQ